MKYRSLLDALLDLFLLVDRLNYVRLLLVAWVGLKRGGNCLGGLGGLWGDGLGGVGGLFGVVGLIRGVWLTLISFW